MPDHSTSIQDSPNSEVSVADRLRVRRISIAFILLGFLTLLSAMNVVFVTTVMKTHPDGKTDLGPGMLAGIGAHLLPIALGQTALALAIIVCAIRFWNYRSWARKALEVIVLLCGVILLSGLCFGFAALVRGLFFTNPDNPGTRSGLALALLLGCAAGPLAVIVWVVWFALRNLKKAEVLRLVSRTGF